MTSKLHFDLELTVMSCGNNHNKNAINMNTDTEMIKYFENHQEKLEKLYNWVQEDSIDHYPLYPQDNKDVLENISDQRLEEYNKLMKELSIIRFLHPLKFEGNWSAVSFYYDQNRPNRNLELSKGFLFTARNIKERNDKLITSHVTTNNLDDELKNVHSVNSYLYKQINGGWYLFLLLEK